MKPSDILLNTKDKTARIFDHRLDADKEGYSLTAVNNPVIIRQSQIHHRLDDNLVTLVTADNHGALLDIVHPQNAALRRVENGVDMTEP